MRSIGGRAGAPGSAEKADPLMVHPDVRRMLMDAKAFTEGFRALVLWTALAGRSARTSPQPKPSATRRTRWSGC